VAVIMDGNGRWAKRREYELWAISGVDALKDLLRCCKVGDTGADRMLFY